MLAASIRQVQSEELPQAEPRTEHKVEGWKASFLAGTREKIAGKVNDKMINRV